MSSVTVSVQTTKYAASVRLVVSTSVSLSSPLYSGSSATVNNIVKLTKSGLSPGTQYYYGVEIDGVLQTAITGKFKTPSATAGVAGSFKFAFSSCAADGSNHPCFDRIRAQDILFFAHLGDLHYQNIGVNNILLFRAAFDRQFSQARQHRLYREVPTVYIFDDHDYGPNNSNRNSPSRTASMAFFRERVPHPPLVNNGISDPVYFAFEIGRVIFIVTDLRSAASPNADTDNASKTKMGTAQKAWFKGLLSNLANAGRFFVWLSSTPWVPSVTVGADHWGGYSTERTELADHIKANCLGRICILSGDTHAVGLDDGTNGDFATGGGAPVREFTASPLDQFTGTWPATYSSGYILNVGQFGIMEVVDTGGPTITINWTAMLHDGTTLSTMSFTADL